MNYWLMKTEPDVFSIDDLKNHPKKTTQWEGVRNYQARNFMRDEMKKGDKVLIYHSNCNPPGVVGIAEVYKESYPDHFAWDKNSKYFDPKCDPKNPRWFMVDVKYKKKFKKVIPLVDLKNVKALETMLILRKGNRLSITPVTKKEFETIEKMDS